MVLQLTTCVEEVILHANLAKPTVHSTKQQLMLEAHNVEFVCCVCSAAYGGNMIAQEIVASVVQIHGTLPV
jgi:hypothetical protein